MNGNPVGMGQNEVNHVNHEDEGKRIMLENPAFCITYLSVTDIPFAIIALMFKLLVMLVIMTTKYQQ